MGLSQVADFSLLSSRDIKDWGALWGLFCESTNPVHEGSVLMT